MFALNECTQHARSKHVIKEGDDLSGAEETAQDPDRKRGRIRVFSSPQASSPHQRAASVPTVGTLLTW